MENTILATILIVGILVAIGVMIHTAIDEYKNTKIRETATRIAKTRRAYTGSLTDNSQQSKVSDDDPKVTSSHPRKKRQNNKSKTKSRRNTVKAGRRANR